MTQYAVLTILHHHPPPPALSLLLLFIAAPSHASSLPATPHLLIFTLHDYIPGHNIQCAPCLLGVVQMEHKTHGSRFTHLSYFLSLLPPSSHTNGPSPNVWRRPYIELYTSIYCMPINAINVHLLVLYLCLVCSYLNTQLCPTSQLLLYSVNHVLEPQ